MGAQATTVLVITPSASHQLAAPTRSLSELAVSMTAAMNSNAKTLVADMLANTTMLVSSSPNMPRSAQIATAMRMVLSAALPVHVLFWFQHAQLVRSQLLITMKMAVALHTSVSVSAKVTQVLVSPHSTLSTTHTKRAVSLTHSLAISAVTSLSQCSVANTAQLITSRSMTASRVLST